MKKQSKSTLSRTMGLAATTSIGVGTMVGAGIFVFPGIAGGQAGPSAMFSFLLSGVIALMVAACAAELSTAMPKSGGAYFFISRSNGPFLGTIIGIAQWVGLVFACAFYLAGFGQYCLELMKQLTMGVNLGPVVFALPATIILLFINILGTKNVGKLQNIIVISLTALLLLIYSYGFLDVFGIDGEGQVFTTVFPNDKGVVFSTAALIFTSYLGFVQISTIAGEVKDPSRNLPRALIGSVVIVLGLYLFVLFVTTSLLSVEELKDLGEAATLEVARRLIGGWGVIVVLISGLLATLSSANASMLSSSRSIFALSKDELIPTRAGKINRKFQTPHLSLILAAVPISMLLFKSNLTLFAEVASFLHLIIYAGICISLFNLRREKPTWFAPSFKIPQGKIIALTGALCCLGLIFFMAMQSILVGLAIIGASGLYYLIFRKGKQLASPKLDGGKDKPLVKRVLIPIDISGDYAVRIPHQLIKILKASHILILGYRKIPEQTDPKQVEEERLQSLQGQFDELMDDAERSQIDTVHEVVCTKDVVETISRAVEKNQCHAILSAQPIENIKRILLPLYHPDQLTNRLQAIVNQLKKNKSNVAIEAVIIPLKKDQTRTLEDWKNMIHERLGDDIKVNLKYGNEVSNKPPKSSSKIIKNVAKKTDLVLLAESDVSNRNSFFNRIHRKIEKAVQGPIMVILKEKGQEG